MIIAFHLLLTLAFELLIYGLGDKFKMKSILAMYIGNILLNLTMNIVITTLPDKTSYLIFVITYEILTFITEAFLYYLFTDKKLWYCFIIAFTANILSLAIGNVFNYTEVIYKNDVVVTLIVSFALIVALELFISVFLYLRPFLRTVYDKWNKGGRNKESNT